MGNDHVGCCTCAAAGHQIQAWTYNESSEVTLPEAEVLTAYSAITGYDPARPETDQGAYCLDVLNYWRQTGIGGRTFHAYVEVNRASRHYLRAAVGLFGGVYVGLNLPRSAQGQAVWEVMPDNGSGHTVPGSWGGHAVNLVAYNWRYLTCVTWGRTQRMSWDFWLRYGDECYVILSPADWLSDNLSPSGFDLAALDADLEAIT